DQLRRPPLGGLAQRRDDHPVERREAVHQDERHAQADDERSQGAALALPGLEHLSRAGADARGGGGAHGMLPSEVVRRRRGVRRFFAGRFWSPITSAPSSLTNRNATRQM